MPLGQQPPREGRRATPAALSSSPPGGQASWAPTTHTQACHPSHPHALTFTHMHTYPWHAGMQAHMLICTLTHALPSTFMCTHPCALVLTVLTHCLSRAHAHSPSGLHSLTCALPVAPALCAPQRPLLGRGLCKGGWQPEGGGHIPSPGSSKAVCSSRQHLALLPFSLSFGTWKTPNIPRRENRPFITLWAQNAVIENGLTQIAFSEEPRELEGSVLQKGGKWGEREASSACPKQAGSSEPRGRAPGSTGLPGAAIPREGQSLTACHLHQPSNKLHPERTLLCPQLVA